MKYRVIIATRRRTLIPTLFGPVVLMLMLGTALPLTAATTKGSVLNLPPNAPAVEVDACVMTVDLRRNFLWVGEKRVFVSRFRYAGHLRATRLQNTKGRRIRLGDFKSGQRVLVRGYRRSTHGIVADSIQQLPPYGRPVRMHLKPLRPVL